MRVSSQRTMVLEALTELSDVIDSYESQLKYAIKDKMKIKALGLNTAHENHRIALHSRMIRILWGKYNRILTTLNEY